MAVIMGVFFVAIATATFIENDFGTAAARSWVYNAPWFNILLLIGAINLLAAIITNRQYRKEKFTLFLFHLAFVLILTGAGITRFTGYEGTMTIREGQTADGFLLNQDYFVLSVREGDRWTSASKPFTFSPFSNRFSLQLGRKQQSVVLKLVQTIPNAMPAVEYSPGGIAVAELLVSYQDDREKFLLKRGTVMQAGSLRFSFEGESSQAADVMIIRRENQLFFRSATVAEHTTMADQSMEKLSADSLHPFIPRHLYVIKGNVIVLTNFVPSSRIIAVSDDQQENGSGRDAAWVSIMSGGLKHDLLVWKSTDRFSGKEKFSIGKKEVQVTYGPLPVKLPFSLTLTDFRLERYPGSNSPSWYESRVILMDSARDIREPRRIFMNNVLKYKGFRFYQASYEPDEKGTILSVNHDLAGTSVTYSGYLLLTLGMLLSLLNRNSRFRQLARETRRFNRTGTNLIFILVLSLFPLDGHARQNGNSHLVPVNAAHAESFGRLLVQDIDGRIEPMNTMSSQILRKLYRKDHYKGMNADQVFLGMIVDPGNWQHEPIIRSRHAQIREIMGGGDSYYSFASFFINAEYKLQPWVENAYRKKPAYRSRFENEIIRLDERVNITYLVLTGALLHIFHQPGDSTFTWYTPAQINKLADTADSVFLQNIIPQYIDACRKSLTSGNWNDPDRLLQRLSQYQLLAGKPVIPNERRVKAEILLNKVNLFDRLSDYYGILGLILLLYQVIGLFFIQIRDRIPLLFVISPILILFILHTAGLILRWYVAGHAPWSNGYEVLIYVAWATVLAGIIFARQSGITLSTTSVLASLILLIAHLSWMDPQITSLVPVLKSHWLVIHVATITASYGFLAMGALLAFVNLSMMAFLNHRNLNYIEPSIRQLTAIIEMSLIIGLYLLTAGTFLGAVWANESWGRYWGWDPKETWALATVVVYAFILHMRQVPELKGSFSFNLAALLGLSSVIMTYFGVNYYLSGLHSYAKGDPLPIPAFVYYGLGIIMLVSLFAFRNQRRLFRRNTEKETQAGSRF